MRKKDIQLDSGCVLSNRLNYRVLSTVSQVMLTWSIQCLKNKVFILADKFMALVLLESRAIKLAAQPPCV